MDTGLVKSGDLAKKFEQRSGVSFTDPSLLETALTHASFARTTSLDNERLEFLGDRVLALVIVEELFRRFPTEREGQLARRLNSLVRKETCAQVAISLDLGGLMRDLVPGRGKVNDNVFDSTNVMGDACEAVIAAVYLDSGLDGARKFILHNWDEFITIGHAASKDPKSYLQEWALGRGLPVPEYTEKSRTGPDHAPLFVMTVSVMDNGQASGEGPSKRQAEQAAAEEFIRINDIMNENK